ncbi:hypothetical protein C8R47DRAFT_1074275 [Mycena vitilis]|nr:hypothetical protein C8R47DRAFT_1074275 [Mycena vitilis]
MFMGALAVQGSVQFRKKKLWPNAEPNFRFRFGHLLNLNLNFAFGSVRFRAHGALEAEKNGARDIAMYASHKPVAKFKQTNGLNAEPSDSVPIKVHWTSIPLFGMDKLRHMAVGTARWVPLVIFQWCTGLGTLNRVHHWEQFSN